ncbi:MAG: hypothetical protein JWQ71_3167 [Pedosphaera sp.]|nr:hypothetical protein [Pedosphaera sp.]
MKTNSLFVTNSPALPGTNDIRAIKPPVEIPTYWILLWCAIGALVLIAIVYFAWRYWRKKATEPQLVRVVPPHERARLKLQEALALINQPRPFCILVSDTVRLYLEERFNFHAPERTTEEFLHELQASKLLLPDQKHSLSEFLSICDMVKFAQYEPGPPELQALHESAVWLIDETEPQPEPQNQASAPSQA